LKIEALSLRRQAQNPSQGRSLRRGFEGSGLLTPERSSDEVGFAESESAMHPTHGIHLDNAGGDLDEAQAQGVEWVPRRSNV
jgi:hypothetical protein